MHIHLAVEGQPDLLYRGPWKIVPDTAAGNDHPWRTALSRIFRSHVVRGVCRIVLPCRGDHAYGGRSKELSPSSAAFVWSGPVEAAGAEGSMTGLNWHQNFM